MLEPPPHLSPSSIGSFQSCPLKFKYSKIDKIPEPPTEATLKGNFVHEVFELLYALDGETRTPEMARLLARQLWDEKYLELVAPIVPAAKHNDFRWSAWFCIENLWGIENPRSTRVDEIEYELNGFLGGVRLKGFIDRFSFDDEGKIVVGDYKTGKVPSARWEDDKFFQLFVYAAMLEELEVGSVARVELLYLTAPKVLARSVTPEAIETAVQTVISVKSAIDERCETETFEPIKSPLCNWCSYKTFCPAWKR